MSRYPSMGYSCYQTLFPLSLRRNYVHIPTTSGRAAPPSPLIKITIISVIGTVALSGCPQLLCDIGLADQCETYHVTYSANGADSGTVPVDGVEYEEGDTVTVKANTGGLSRSGYSFAGWNTASNGDGTSYSSGFTFEMEFANLDMQRFQTAQQQQVGVAGDGCRGGAEAKAPPSVATRPTGRCHRRGSSRPSPPAD